MDKENWFTLTVTFTKENGSMTRLMEKVLTLMQMVLITMVTGSMINNTALEWNHGQMVPSMKVTTLMARKKVKES